MKQKPLKDRSEEELRAYVQERINDLKRPEFQTRHRRKMTLARLSRAHGLLLKLTSGKP
jgi:hypothetical protein